MNTQHKINLLTLLSGGGKFRPQEIEINELESAGLLTVERRIHERTGLHFPEHDILSVTPKGAALTAGAN